MENNIQKKLRSFIQEFEAVCKKNNKSPQLLFATKYLNKDLFLSFLSICKDKNEVLIGENRIQDAIEKFKYVESKSISIPSMKRVLIGNLQKNKINKAIEYFDEIHSIDSIDLLKELDHRLKAKGKTMSVYLEVNVSGETSKHGFSSEEIDQLMKQFSNLTIQQFNNVTIKGLMTIAPNTDDQEIIKSVFRKLRTIADRYRLKTSMGMSQDWKIAVEEGSDMIRVGSVIFNQ